MPIRTSPEKVMDVLTPGNDYTPGKPLEPFIRAANKIVNWVQANATFYGRKPNDIETALDVETWLAAWAYKASHQQYASSNAGRSSASFRGQSGKGLEMNNYGQVAIQLDGTGLLGGLANGTLVGTSWLGKALSEMFTYDERNR